MFRFLCFISWMHNVTSSWDGTADQQLWCLLWLSLSSLSQGLSYVIKLYPCNILVGSHFPFSFRLYYATQMRGTYRRVYICACRVVEYCASKNVTPVFLIVSYLLRPHVMAAKWLTGCLWIHDVTAFADVIMTLFHKGRYIREAAVHRWLVESHLSGCFDFLPQILWRCRVLTNHT